MVFALNELPALNHYITLMIKRPFTFATMILYTFGF